jgi:hypothetical protein
MQPVPQDRASPHHMSPVGDSAGTGSLYPRLSGRIDKCAVRELQAASVTVLTSRCARQRQHGVLWKEVEWPNDELVPHHRHHRPIFGARHVMKG